MSEPRVPLYDRLPEIYRIKDEKQPHGQLRSYLALVEEVFGAIHESIESLYHDLFIETCDNWVIPYIGDLLGTSLLKGDPWASRADVADTIALRRRKGTLNAIERLTYNLTQWGVHCVELRENLVWNQHLNHQRPDEGGYPPYGDQAAMQQFRQRGIPARQRVIRGGTVTLRDPTVLSLVNSSFDPFAHLADSKPHVFGSMRYNLPNLAIFLWRLKAYQVRVSKPASRDVINRSATATSGEAKFIACFDIHPVGEPVKLFNRHRDKPTGEPPVVTHIDEMPGPIHPARLSENSPVGNPSAYVDITTYSDADLLAISHVGLQLYVPETEFAGDIWSFRGANLCSWEKGLWPPLQSHEIAIDPAIGRIAIGVDTADQGIALVDALLVSYTYGAVGPVGAYPISRPSTPYEWNGEPIEVKTVNYHEDPNGLQSALTDIQDSGSPIVIEIYDSMTHELDLGAIGGTIDEDGGPNLRLNRSLIIRAVNSQRPIIKLAKPLRFRPTHVKGTNDEEQSQFDAIMSNLAIRLEGLYLARGNSFPANEPLIARAALHSLEIFNCTLDPGGRVELDGTPEGIRSEIHCSMKLCDSYGFEDTDDEKEFNQVPEIILQRTITGPLLIDTDYALDLTETIIDTGKGVHDDSVDSFAVSGASGNPSASWGPPTRVDGITVFGRMRVESISGQGGIWVHALEVQDNQRGCIKFSYFSGNGERLPQNHGCVKGTEATLRFVSEIFGQSAYAQLAFNTDFYIKERGPGDNAMGAFGFLQEAHKWRNLTIRYREFMPVGVRPLLIPVT